MTSPAGSIVARRMTSRSVADRPRAAAGDVDHLEARRRSVIRTGQDDAAERSGGERFGGQVEGPRHRIAEAAEDETLSARATRRRRRPGRGGTTAPPRGPPASAGAVARAAGDAIGRRPGAGRGAQARGPAPTVVDAMSPTAPRAMTPGPIQRSHRDSTMRLTSSGGLEQLAGGGRGRHGARRHLSATYPGSNAADVGRAARRASMRASAPVRERHAERNAAGPPGPPWYRATPCGREAGEIPAQSRYGERSSESASPVADHTVHARTFERKVGRTRAIFRLDPSFDPLEARGFAMSSRPLRRQHRLGGLQPCPRPRPPVPTRVRRRSSLAALVLVLAACAGSGSASPAPTSTASATAAADRRPRPRHRPRPPSPTPAAGLPGHPDRRRRHGRHARGRARRRSSR